MGDIILIAILLLAAGLALRSCLRKKKGGCSGCSGGACCGCQCPKNERHEKDND